MNKLIAAAAIAAITLSAVPATAATWSIFINEWPAENPAVGGPPFADFKVVGPIGNYIAEVDCTNVVKGTAGPIFQFMPFPSSQYGYFWAFCIQTSP